MMTMFNFFQFHKLTCRIPKSQVPLIAVPRLLLKSHKSPSIHASTSVQRAEHRSDSNDDGQLDISEELKRLITLTVLDFSPERIASSIVDLWKDLEGEQSRDDFLRYHRGWVAHVVLLGCFNSTGPEVIERVIEVACCLDLLCQEHDIAITIIQSLQLEAVSRLTAWEKVQQPLAHKMEEIMAGTLAQDVHSSAAFRAPRDAFLEYWILTRPYVDDEHLWRESVAVEPQVNDVSDVETRITQLEALLVTIQPEKSQETSSNRTSNIQESELEVSDVDAVTETETETTSLDLSSSDTEFTDQGYSQGIHSVAQQTRDRISQRLEALKTKVHLKARGQKQLSFAASPLSVPSPKLTSRSVDPLDQRTIFRARANNDGISIQRRSSPSAIYTGNHNRTRSRKQSGAAYTPSGTQEKSDKAFLEQKGSR